MKNTNMITLRSKVPEAIEELTNCLSPPIAHRAIRNMKNFIASRPMSFKEVSQEDAIMWVFDWIESREGGDYWLNVRVNEWRKS